MLITKNISHLQFSSKPGIPAVRFITNESKTRAFGNEFLAYHRAKLAGVDVVPTKTAVRNLLSGQNGNVQIEIDKEQYEQLVKFLDKGPIERYHAGDFGIPEAGQTILAFSYGAKLPVNRAIAGRILDICRGMDAFPPSIIAQWEIADQLSPFKTGINCPLQVKRIPISGFEITNKLTLVRSGLINGIHGRSSKQQVRAAIDRMLDDPKTDNNYWGNRLTCIHDIDDPLPMARLVLGNATSNFRTNYKMGQSSCPDYFRRLVRQFNMASLMMLAPEGSIKFYITSKEVIDGFKNEKGLDGDGKDSGGSRPPVFVVGQSWHGPRILQLCRNNGLNIVGGSFVDMFSENDTQLWVTNPFSWLIKEAGVFAGNPSLFPG